MHEPARQVRVASDRPPIVVVDDSATEMELDEAFAWFVDPDRVRRRIHQTRSDDTGTSFELGASDDAILGPLRQRMSDTLGVTTAIDPVHESLPVEQATLATITTFVHRERDCPTLRAVRSLWP